MEQIEQTLLEMFNHLIVRHPQYSQAFYQIIPEAQALREWQSREFAAPSPHFIKQAAVIRNGLSDATWVESGTFLGETTQKLAQIGKMVHSVEPEPTIFANVKEKFAAVKNVKLYNGLSEEVFPKLIPKLKGDVCFWLDGHYSAGITFKGPVDTPIVSELACIAKNLKKLGRVVVMVDDVRCFNPTLTEYADYPPVDFLVDWARDNNLSWHIEHDIFIAKNH